MAVTDQDFKWLIAEIHEKLKIAPLNVALVNQNTINRFKRLPLSETPIGIKGFQLKKYKRLSDDHVLFFTTVEDAQEFIDACEECITASPETDPEALVGVVIEISKQRLIKSNSIPDKETKHGRGQNP